jgi:hypothetical protein
MKPSIPFRLWWHIFVEHRLQGFGKAAWWGSPVRWIGEVIYVTRRWFEGARRIEIASSYEGTSGHIESASLMLDVAFGCAVPVQGDGEILGHPCYYRSRGEGWSFEVYAEGADVSEGLPDPIWEYSRAPYFWPDGGWVAAGVSRACILEAGHAFAKWKRGEVS